MSTVAGMVAAVVIIMLGIRLRPRPARLHAIAVRPPRHRSSRSTPRRALGALGVAGAAAVAGPFAAVAVIAAIALWPRLQLVRRERRRVAAVAAAFPDFVDLLVLTITSGCSPAQAIVVLADVVPDAVRPAVAQVAHGIDVGKRFADAIAGLQSDPPIGLGLIAQPLADALALADRYGTPLAPVLDRLAEEARSQRRRNAEAAARQLPIRLAFPLVGCTLPSFVLLTIVPLMAGTFSSLRVLTP